MFDLFDFDLPGAVTEQLRRKLDNMQSSNLTAQALQELAHFQRRHRIKQGVYQLLYDGHAAYVGKAIDAKGRLEQHLWKANGRLLLQVEKLEFKCLLLHPNWSTSANEELLIQHYQDQGACLWNLSGFGAKDVGRRRDDTEPNKFDREYPIDQNYRITDLQDKQELVDILQALKTQLPFIFRYGPIEEEENKIIDLAAVPRTARMILAKIIEAIGPEWQATIFVSHIILYKERRHYRFGEVIAERS